MKKLPDYLADGQVVRTLATGTFGGGQGLLALTDRRLVFLKDGVMAKTLEDFPLDRVSSVTWSSGMVMGTLSITVASNKAEVTNVPKTDGKAFSDAARDAVGAALRPMAQTPALAAPDVTTQLLQLKQLLDAGVLHQAEYEAKKVELLARL
jgi:PH (Pleckstrin Homology) domain-containing protein